MSKFVEVKPNYYINPALLYSIDVPDKDNRLQSLRDNIQWQEEVEKKLIDELTLLEPNQRDEHLPLLNAATNEKMRLSMLLEQESKWWDLGIVTNNRVEIQFRYESENERNTVYGLLVGKQL